MQKTRFNSKIEIIEIAATIELTDEIETLILYS